mgnify:FL=1|jgi:hypothetical protein
MNDIKNVKLTGFLKAILKKEYPLYMSKDFSSKVMKQINKSAQGYNFFSYGLRIASAMTFAVITLFVMDNVFTDKIQYSKSSINQEILSPTRNVANQMEKCEDAKDSIQSSDSLKCK